MSILLTAITIICFLIAITQQNYLSHHYWKRSSPSDQNYWWQVNSPWKHLPGLREIELSSEVPLQFIESEIITVSPPAVKTVAECVCVPTIKCDMDSGLIVDYGSGSVDFRGVQSCDADMVCCIPQEDSEELVLPTKETQIYQSNEEFTDCGTIADLYTLKGSDDVIYRFNVANDRIETDQGQFPWTLALMVKTKKGDTSLHKCAAALLSATIAVTAAHCVDRVKNPEDLTLHAGEWDLELDGEIIPPQTQRVKTIQIHPNYSRRPIKNDVALLEVEAPFLRNPLVNNICLPGENVKFEGEQCYATGWNVKSEGSTMEDRKLKMAKLSIMPFTKCQDRYRNIFGQLYKLHHSFLCAIGDNGEDTSKGDGGGPLACSGTEEERFYLAGVTSWGEGKSPGAYSDIAGMFKWINEAIFILNEKYT